MSKIVISRGPRSLSGSWAAIHSGAITCTSESTRPNPKHFPPPFVSFHLSCVKKNCVCVCDYRWNAARALSSFLQRNPELYVARTVLELGAGGGLPGLVTAKCDARKVHTVTSSRPYYYASRHHCSLLMKASLSLPSPHPCPTATKKRCCDLAKPKKKTGTTGS
jgi:hypothetical protein